MNLASLLDQIGLSDGQGNTSSMRIMLYTVILAILAPAIYIAFVTKTGLTLTSEQLELIGMALGAKCVQNQQEKDVTPNNPPTATPVTKP
jgi:hypothetical protein